MMYAKILSVILCLKIFSLNACTCEEDNAPLIQLNDGTIRGREAKTIGLNQIYYAFQSIPYAKPPVGELRFQAPIPNDPWTGILDATEDKVQCVQGSNPVKGSEDCLVINVYVPTSLSSTNKKPVLVSIFGGYYMQGNGSYEYGAPDYLLDEDLICVSFNYRIGIFGFFSSGDSVAPGNAGLKDQVLALKWVQNNIENFGGDPNNVTIFGQSSGASSVAHLVQSPLTTGLFKGAIMNSGSALCRWTLSRDARTFAFNLGRKFSYKNKKNSTGLLEKLQSVDYMELQTTANSLATSTAIYGNILNGLILTPVIEHVHDGAVFSTATYELLSTGQFQQVPILMGFNSNEAAVAPNSIFLKLYFEKYLLDPCNLIPTDMDVSFLWKLLVGGQINLRYFGVLPPFTSMASIVTYIGDELFVRPIIQAAKLQSKYTPVFLYMFQYQGNLAGLGKRSFSGAVHTEDLSYIYRQFNNVESTPQDNQMRSIMIKLWTNFAKYGNPTPWEDTLTQNITWTNLSNDKMNYLIIDSNLTMAEKPRASMMKFWNGLYDAYGRPPFKTY